MSTSAAKINRKRKRKVPVDRMEWKLLAEMVDRGYRRVLAKYGSPMR